MDYRGPSYQPTYQLYPENPEKFHPSQVKTLCEKILKDNLEEEAYESERMQSLVLELCDTIKANVKNLSIPRYKIVVQVSIGELKNQTVRIASRCLWDVENDNYCSVTYKNNEIWATAVVFGFYSE